MSTAASLNTVWGSASRGASGARVLLGTHVGARFPGLQTLSPSLGPVSRRPPKGPQASKEGKAVGVLAVPSILVRIVNLPAASQWLNCY